MPKTTLGDMLEPFLRCHSAQEKFELLSFSAKKRKLDGNAISTNFGQGKIESQLKVAKGDVLEPFSPSPLLATQSRVRILRTKGDEWSSC